MRKSGGETLKGVVNQNQNLPKDNINLPVSNGGVDWDLSILLKKANELKEEGNKRFRCKDYVGAIEEYNIALKLIPKLHPDRAALHSNKAASLMQMKPIYYEAVIAECSMALMVQPHFASALIRRACAFEAIGEYDMAMQDVQLVLGVDPDNKNVVDMYQRLRIVLGTRQEAQQDLHSHPSPAGLLKVSLQGESSEGSVQWRSLKLVYDHDIRLAKMPVGCNFKVLREIVRERFPAWEWVVIKYKDHDGDLVTITCTSELRMAESLVDSLKCKEPKNVRYNLIGMLRLHIVEVSPEQEPLIVEEEEDKSVDSEGVKVDGNGSYSSLGESVTESLETEVKSKSKKSAVEGTPAASEEHELKEVEMDDWLFEFAQLFRSHVGIDPDVHIDLHELGMELCSEALEDTVTSEEAQSLFDKASVKFQEVAALAFFNWGNVHMCAARKRIPIDDSAAKDLMASQLQAYDWVKEKYCLARKKYEEALFIKPDFYEGLLALAQQQFEMAKLHWSYVVVAKKDDLSQWDPTETFRLFDSAEEKIKAATKMWEEMEEQRATELKDPSSSRRKEFSKRTKKYTPSEGELNQVELSPDDGAEQVAVMRSQIHLFWGNMLFERSQVECKLGFTNWEEKLDTAVEQFMLAGASDVDISTVLKNHCSSGKDAEGNERKGS